MSVAIGYLKQKLVCKLCCEMHHLDCQCCEVGGIEHVNHSDRYARHIPRQSLFSRPHDAAAIDRNMSYKSSNAMSHRSRHLRGSGRSFFSLIGTRCSRHWWRCYPTTGIYRSFRYWWICATDIPHLWRKEETIDLVGFPSRWETEQKERLTAKSWIQTPTFIFHS